MNFKSAFFICAISVYSDLHAGVPDSLIKFGDLVFKSEFEKASFYKYVSDKSSDLTDIFLSPYKKEAEYNSLTVHEKINNCVNILNGMVADKPDSKKVKTVYSYVHKTFFKVYKFENSFSDIFSKGEYNCVSASALYAIIFSKLDIPFQIKETPHHVYLEAYPNTGKMLIETTSPEKGYIQFSDEFTREYIQKLYRSKLITKEQIDSTSTTALFNKYFFSSEDISLIQLAGLQFVNYGIYYLDEKNHSAAINELKKAYYLNPCELTKYTLEQALLLNVSNSNYTHMEQVHNLVILCHYNNLQDDEISNEVIRSEFSRIIQSQLISNSDYAKFDSSYFLISGALTDSTVKNEIAFDYHYELSRLGFLNSKDAAYELKHLEAAYAINHNNANLQSIILGYFGRIAEKSNDVAAMMNTMEDYSRRFPFLNENELFNAAKANCFLELSFRSYSINNFSKGDNYIKAFEDLYEKQNKMAVNESYIEKAYMTAAGVYYKKGNYTKSKQYVKTGLNYIPQSFGLNQMMRQY